MGSQQVTSIAHWLKNWIPTTAVKEVSLEIIGGEPLLNIEPLADINHVLEALNISVSASLITNGLLLDRNIITKLVEQKVNKIQITFDGPREIHDAIKSIDGKGTFDHLYNICKDILLSEIRLHLRVNYPPGRRDLALETLHQLKGLVNEKSKICVYFSQIFDKNDRHSFLDILQSDEFALEREAIKLGFTIPFPMGAPICSGNSDTGFVITPNNEVYKCYGFVGENQHKVGIIENGELIISSYGAISQKPRDECVPCKYFPICNGGCKVQRHFSETNDEQLYCSIERYDRTANELLPLFLEAEFKDALLSLSKERS